jgi:hypothetical protein
LEIRGDFSVFGEGLEVQELKQGFLEGFAGWTI